MIVCLFVCLFVLRTIYLVNNSLQKENFPVCCKGHFFNIHYDFFLQCQLMAIGELGANGPHAQGLAEVVSRQGAELARIQPLRMGGVRV